MTRFSIKAITWKFKTATTKSWINLQDRYGWYSYTDWMQEIEANVIGLYDEEAIFQSEKDFKRSASNMSR